MPDALVVYQDNASPFRLENLARQYGFRTKSTFQTALAEEWLKLHSYDALLMDLAFSLEEQQELAGLLWQKDALACFCVYDFSPESKVTGTEAKLFGAEIAKGAKADEVIARCLRALTETPRQAQELAAENFRVMVVEDLDSPRDIICMYIESLGYPAVTGFSSAKEAIEVLEKDPQKYSCIVTDIRMPQVSGKELVEHVRSSPALEHLPIIVVTAYGTVDSLIDCLRAGASGFLVKPPKKKDLSWELARARRIIARRASPRLATGEDAEAMRDLLVDKGYL